MAVINIIGWETGTDNLEATLSGTAAITSAKANTGGGTYSLRVNPTTTGTGYAIIQQHSTAGILADMNNATLYIRFYIYLENLPAAAEKIIEARDTSGTLKGEVRVLDTGVLRIVDKTVNAITTSNTALAADTWYMIEWLVPTGASATSTLRINGVQDGSATGDFGTVNTGTFRLGKATNVNGSSVDFYYDDVCVKDDDWPGTGVVVLLAPTSNGTYTAWTDEAGNNDANDWDSAEEVPHDSDTTYLKTSTNTNVETVNVGNLTISTHYITAIKSNAVMRSASASASVQVRLRSNTTDDDTSSTPIANSSYVLVGKVYATDPATAASWTVSGVNAVEVGVEHNTAASRELRCTALYVTVDARLDLSGNAYLSSINSINNSPRLSERSSCNLDSIFVTSGTGRLSFSNNDTKFVSIGTIISTTEFALSLGGTSQIFVISQVDNTPRLNLGGNSNVFTISSTDLSARADWIADSSIHTISNINTNPQVNLVTSASFITISDLLTNLTVQRGGEISLFTITSLDGVANNSLGASSNLSSIVQIDSSANKSISAIADINTISELSLTSQATHIGSADISTISLLSSSANNSILAGSNLYTISQIDNSPTKSAGALCDIFTISQLNGDAKVAIVASFGISTISEVFASGSSGGGLVTSDIATISSISASANVTHMASGFFDSISSLNIAGGLLHFALVNIFTVTEFKCEARLEMVVHSNLGSVGHLTSDGTLSAGQEFFARLMSIVELAATPKIIRGSTADLGTIITLEASNRLAIGGQISLNTICHLFGNGGFILSGTANLGTIFVTSNTGGLITLGSVTGSALIETVAELRATPYIRDYTIFGDNEGLPFYVCIFYEDDFICD